MSGQAWRFNLANERIKRAYVTFLKHTTGKGEGTLDKVLAALVQFKDHLAKARNARTGNRFPPTP